MEPVIRLLVRGERACFMRPEMKVERTSYAVMTPAAARVILGAIYMKPAIRWEIVRIHVLRPIRFELVAQLDDGLDDDECGSPRARLAPFMPARRSTTLLRDVEYLVEAKLQLTHRASLADTQEAHLEMFAERARARHFFQQPCLGDRAFQADFELLEPGTPLPLSLLPSDQSERDLGWMLHDIDFTDGQTSRFFRARLRGGVLEVLSALGMERPAP